METSRIRKIFGVKSFTLIFVVVMVVAFFFILNHNYLGIDNIKGILNAISLSGVIMVGMACLLISGQIDLAAGSEACMGGVLAAVFIRGGMPWPAAVLVVLIYGVLAGLIISFLVNVLNIMSFIATIALASVYAGLINVITNSQTIAISNKSFWVIGTSGSIGVPIPFIIMAVLLIIYGIILSYTRFGRSVYMCGGNRVAARLAGIDPKKIHTILFINNSVISSLAGIVLAARMHSGSPIGASTAHFDAITGAILGGVAFTGGTGGMFGSFLGLLLLTCFNNGLTVVNLQPYWQIVARGSLLIIALLIDFYRERARMKSMKFSNNLAIPAKS